MIYKSKTLAEVSIFIRNGASIKQSDIASGLPITRIETISDRTINLDKCGYADLKDSDFKDYRLVRGDILISHINSEKHLGKCAIFEENRNDIVHGMNLLCLRPSLESVFPRYLFHYLSSQIFLSLIPKITKKSVNQASFTVTAFKELEIHLPPLEEQKRIAAILDKAHAIRRKRQEAIKFADEFLRAVFLDMFGDPVTNPKGWEVKQLKDIVSKIGSGSTPKGGKESYLSEGISLIRSLNIHDNEFRYKDLAFISDQQAKKLANVIVEKNDVLLNITGASVCRCAIVPENVLPARVNQHVAIIRTKSINPIYLMHLLISKSYKHILLLLSGSGATREALTKEQIENLEVPCPPNDLQNRFQEIESKVSEFTNRLDIFAGNELFNSLSQKAFSE